MIEGENIRTEPLTNHKNYCWNKKGAHCFCERIRASFKHSELTE